MNHALSTEKEEIMGLLLGHVAEEVSDGRNDATDSCSHIESVVILQRSDRKADRVEISPEQLIGAAREGERLSRELGRQIRVLGWYHSHPHITVGPSHVDLRTQMDYQVMDPDFVGLIFSVFPHQQSDKFAGVTMICFQTMEDRGRLECKELRVDITSKNKINEYCLKALVEIPRALCSEERQLYQDAQLDGVDIITRLHNAAVFSQSLCQLVENCEVPCISALSAYEKSLESKLRELKRQKAEMEDKEFT